MMRSVVLCHCAFQRWAWVASMLEGIHVEGFDVEEPSNAFATVLIASPSLSGLKEKCQSFRVSPGEFFCLCQVGNHFTFQQSFLAGKTKTFRGNLGRGIPNLLNWDTWELDSPSVCGKPSSKFQIWKSSS